MSFSTANTSQRAQLLFTKTGLTQNDFTTVATNAHFFKMPEIKTQNFSIIKIVTYARTFVSAGNNCSIHILEKKLGNAFLNSQIPIQNIITRLSSYPQIGQALYGQLTGQVQGNYSASPQISNGLIPDTQSFQSSNSFANFQTAFPYNIQPMLFLGDLIGTITLDADVYVYGIKY